MNTSEKGKAMFAAAPTPWYKQRWPWLLAIMPTIAIFTSFTTLWLAIKTDDGLVTDDYYKDGLAINKVIARDETARRYNLGAVARLAGDSVSLELESSLPASPDSLQLTLNHPTHQGLDHAILLTRNRVGAYVGKVKNLVNARYDVILEPLNGAWRIAGQWRPTEGETLRLNSAAMHSSGH